MCICNLNYCSDIGHIGLNINFSEMIYSGNFFFVRLVFYYIFYYTVYMKRKKKTIISDFNKKLLIKEMINILSLKLLLYKLVLLEEKFPQFEKRR